MQPGCETLRKFDNSNGFVERIEQSPKQTGLLSANNNQDFRLSEPTNVCKRGGTGGKRAVLLGQDAMEQPPVIFSVVQERVLRRRHYQNRDVSAGSLMPCCNRDIPEEFGGLNEIPCRV